MNNRETGPYRSKTLHNAYRELLQELNRAKVDPASDLDSSAVAEVTDYLLDRIDAYRPVAAPDKTEKVTPENAQFATPENRLDNGSTTGAR